ncbi:hypothetical protein LRS14_18465 [Aquincola sp. J276]|nr:hypothetical protein [Aquincola sp. J276]MCR5867154.1 hypothetical protein [Aquincola sp. J276]
MPLAAAWAGTTAAWLVAAVLGSQAWRALQRLQAEADGAAQRLQQLLAEAQRMARAHEAGDIDAVMPLDAFEVEGRLLAQQVNALVGSHIAVKKQALECVRRFGQGDFHATLEALPCKKAFINEVIEQVRANLVGLVAELNQMSREHDAGDIDVVIDSRRFAGDFRTMADGINRMVAGHIAVKKKAMPAWPNSAAATSMRRSMPFQARRPSSTRWSSRCAATCRP